MISVGYPGTGLFAAGSNHRLLSDMTTALLDPSMTWSWEAGIIAGRAQELVANDGLAQAMIGAKIDNTHGPLGLRAKSFACLDTIGTTSPGERILRGQVEQVIDRARGHSFSADGMFTRRQLIRQLDWMATVLGEGYLVRVKRPRPWAKNVTAWRLVRPERICNPDGRPNDSTLYEGIELADGEMVAIWIRREIIAAFGASREVTWDRIPVVATDGTRNVIRRTGLLLPGMLRGVSMFAPLMILLKQLAGTVEAHVATKRAQACMPIITYTDDPEELQAAQDSGYLLSPHVTFAPLKVLFARLGQQVQLPQIDFKGADLRDFLTTCWQITCAAWGMPVEVVTCRMGDASLSSARAGLDQLDRTAQGWQQDDIEQVEQPIDHAMIAEAVATGELTPGAAGIAGLCEATYQRPPKYSTDRLKDANAATAWIAAGRSKTSVFAEYGYDADAEREQKTRDDEADALARAQLAGAQPGAAATSAAESTTPPTDPTDPGEPVTGTDPTGLMDDDAIDGTDASDDAAVTTEGTAA